MLRAFLVMCCGIAFAAPGRAPNQAIDWTVTVDGNGVYGAGVLIDPSRGLVLTCRHVVAEMKSPRVAFSDGASFLAQIVDSDNALDVALLRVPPQKRPAPPLAEADGPGQEIFAVGYPRRLAFTLSRGIVSFVGRVVGGVNWLQTDLPMNEGNSGGPVINARGELLGLMSFVYRGAQGISFAVPARAAVERFKGALGRSSAAGERSTGRTPGPVTSADQSSRFVAGSSSADTGAPHR
jgi:S1-C subfamily serine protease